MLIEMVDEFYKDYPEVEKEKIKETTQYTWKQLYNNGKDVPKGNNDYIISTPNHQEILQVSN